MSEWTRIGVDGDSARSPVLETPGADLKTTPDPEGCPAGRGCRRTHGMDRNSGRNRKPIRDKN